MIEGYSFLKKNEESFIVDGKLNEVCDMKLKKGVKIMRLKKIDCSGQWVFYVL